MRIATRLYLDQPLHRTATPQLSLAQIHQLRTVLRLAPGDGLALFNARDGEWAAKIEQLTKRQARLVIHEQRRLPDMPGQADLWLLSAPIKRARIDIVVEKATELGVTRFQPVMTRLTAVTRINLARLRAQAIEAAEQCDRLHVPEIAEAIDLERLLRDWPANRRLLLCDEVGAQAGSAAPLGDLAVGLAGQPLALLIGPEGGFAPSELDLLRQLPFLSCVSLGPRILRADTAAIAALAIVQAVAGDWRSTSAAR